MRPSPGYGFSMTVEELYNQWEWKSIPHCPGRYILVTSNRSLPLRSLLNDETCQVDEYDSPHSRDRVLVVRLMDGGLISYRRDDGTMVHTLNSPEGFHRKLVQLGIEDVNLL